MSTGKRKTCDGLTTDSYDNIKIGKTRFSSNATLYREVRLPDSSGTLLLAEGDLNVDNLSVTGVIRAPNGTASAPSFSFTGDTNSGLFSSGSDAVSISCGGVNQVTADATNTTVNNTLAVPALNITEGIVIGSNGTGYYGSGSRIGCIRMGFISLSSSIGAGSGIQVSAASEDLPAVGSRYVFANIYCPAAGTGNWDRVLVTVAPGGLPTTRPGNLTFQLVNLAAAATTGSALLSWMCIVQADNP